MTNFMAKETLLDCGWCADFVNLISEWEATMLTNFKDPDEQIIYADHLAMDYKYEGEYFDE